MVDCECGGGGVVLESGVGVYGVFLCGVFWFGVDGLVGLVCGDGV